MMKQSKGQEVSVLVWGTYDTGKPRTRIIIKALRKIHPDILEVHNNIWNKIEDKSQIKGRRQKSIFIAKYILAYPSLIFRYLLTPKHKVLFIPYMGVFDLILIWPLARIRGVKIYLDLFISLYDTIVIDRKLVSESSLFAKLLYTIEWLSLRLADKLIIDTKTHARYIESLFHLEGNTINVVWVGAEEEHFYKKNAIRTQENKIHVLFYGQFIPLHGLDTIIGAAELLKDSHVTIEFTIIGKGQLQARIDSLIQNKQLTNIKRLEWITYSDLNDMIASSDICLGIFAPQGKALRVIPNKVFQAISSRKAFITADTPAIRELTNENGAIVLIPPGNPDKLAQAIVSLSKRITNGNLDLSKMPIINIQTISSQLKTVMQQNEID